MRSQLRFNEYYRSSTYLIMQLHDCQISKLRFSININANEIACKDTHVKLLYHATDVQLENLVAGSTLTPSSLKRPARFKEFWNETGFSHFFGMVQKILGLSFQLYFYVNSLQKKKLLQKLFKKKFSLIH